MSPNELCDRLLFSKQNFCGHFSDFGNLHYAISFSYDNTLTCLTNKLLDHCYPENIKGCAATEYYNEDMKKSYEIWRTLRRKQKRRQVNVQRNLYFYISKLSEWVK